MTLHKITCSNGHVFHFKLELPGGAKKTIEASEGTICPICRCKEINVCVGEVEEEE